MLTLKEKKRQKVLSKLLSISKSFRDTNLPSRVHISRTFCKSSHSAHTFGGDRRDPGCQTS